MTNLVLGDTNSATDVFVHDRENGITERVSVASNGTEADRSSRFPAIGSDERFTSFAFYGSNLVPNHTNSIGNN